MDNMVIWKEGKQFRCGFTTGSCAAAAAKAAVKMLLTKEPIDHIEIMTPKGIPFTPLIEHITISDYQVRCSVKKDGGDDPDVTTGLYITATVKRIPGNQIEIDGGLGVGRVTKKGLEQPVGAAAINQIPRKMIAENVREVLAECQVECEVNCGIQVVISAEGGEEAAKKTFNPRLGIAGGISILGTSGIVIPMSEKALTDTIDIDIKMQINQGNGYVIAVPGNYGIRFCKETFGIEEDHIVICSNYIGETIDAAAKYGAKGLLLVGHTGKFVKLAAGIMNTHSKEADGRMEVLASHTILCGGSASLANKILQCITTDEAVELLQKHELKNPVMESIVNRSDFHIKKRVKGDMEIGMMIYSFTEGLLGKTVNANQLLKKIKEKT